MLAITDDDLMAYADGQLAGERREAVEQALARDAALAARVASIREQNAALRDALDPWLAEAIPPRLIAAAEGRAGGGRLLRMWPALAAAATLVLGIAVGWFGRDAMLERSGTPTTLIMVRNALDSWMRVSSVCSTDGATVNFSPAFSTLFSSQIFWVNCLNFTRVSLRIGYGP